jgi:hypothetical protein
MGGEATLPEVLAPEDARPLLGERWYDSARMLDALPGVRITGGVWRCDRTTFLNWLREMCNATTN